MIAGADRPSARIRPEEARVTSSPSSPQLDLRVAIEVEHGDGPVLVIRLRPLAPKVGNARPRDRGPLGLPLIAELQRACAARCRAIGYGGPTGGIGGSWAVATLVMPSADVETVTSAVRALLDGDELPAHTYLRSPPRLTYDKRWEAPGERF